MAQLSASGEDVVGRIRCPQFLLLARTLLLGRPGTGLPWKWWALRTLTVQQRILSGPAASLQTDIEQLTEEVRQPSNMAWTCPISPTVSPLARFTLLDGYAKPMPKRLCALVCLCSSSAAALMPTGMKSTHQSCHIAV